MVDRQAATNDEARQMEIVFDCPDGDGPVPGYLVTYREGDLVHTRVSVNAGGYAATLLDTGDHVYPEGVCNNPFRVEGVRSKFMRVLPLIMHANGRKGMVFPWAKADKS